MNRTVFSKNLRDIIENRFKGNRKAFCDFIGKSGGNVDVWIRELSEPTFKSLEQICQRLNVDRAWLIGEDTTKKPSEDKVYSEKDLIIAKLESSIKDRDDLLNWFKSLVERELIKIQAPYIPQASHQGETPRRHEKQYIPSGVG